MYSNTSSVNIVKRGHLFLKNPKESIPNTDGIYSMTIHVFDQLVSPDELKNAIKGINVSNLVNLCIEMNSANDVLRVILEVYPTLANQFENIWGKNMSYSSVVYRPLNCTSFKVFSDYEFPSVTKIEFDCLPDTPLTGLPNTVVCLRDVVVNKNRCETIFNQMKRIKFLKSNVRYMPTCEWICFSRCMFDDFDEEHEQNDWINEVTKTIKFEKCEGILPSIRFESLTSMYIDEHDYHEFSLNNCRFPNIDECVLNNYKSFNTWNISCVKRLSIRGDVPNMVEFDNLESLSLYIKSVDILSGTNEMSNIKTKDLLIEIIDDEEWHHYYNARDLAYLNTSKLKSVSIIGASMVGDIEPLKIKFEEAGVESCTITFAVTQDILKKD